MTTTLYAVYDKIACRSGPIFHAVNDADAIRDFRRKYRDNPDREDFRLVKIGTMDHEKTIVDALDIPEDIVFTWPGNHKEAPNA